jgi:regulator of PEP synthase PpsR (kinase-PPPase family)
MPYAKMHPVVVSQGRPPDRIIGKLRRAEALYRAHRLPVINSSAKSVEEMSTIILQTINRPR